MYRFCFITCILGMLALTGCREDRTETTYDEPIITAEPQQAPQQAPAQHSADIHWHIPPGWEKQAAADGITAESYSLGGVKLTITPLSGMAGGIDANVQRWRRQAGLPPFSDEELKMAIAEVKTGLGTGYLAKVSNSDSTPTQTFGAIIPYQGTTWFVKMTGPYAELTDARWQELQNIVKTAHPGSH